MLKKFCAKFELDFINSDIIETDSEIARVNAPMEYLILKI